MEVKTHEASKKYLSVLADGHFHQSVPEGTEGAVVRTYEDKEGNEQTKTELVFNEVSGTITKLTFEDGNFGQNLEIELDGEGVVSLPTSSNFGEDIMKKLPAVDLSKPVRLVPYAFEDAGKSKKGVTVYQDGAKVENYYWSADRKIAINGMPSAGDTSNFKSDDWKMHFMVVRKFLVKEIEALAGKI